MAKLQELTDNLTDFTTAQQSFALSRNNVQSNNNLLMLIGKLSDISSRNTTSKSIARLLDAENLFIFIKDTDLNILLPALGFQQTIQNGKAWNTFLDNCISKKTYTGKLAITNQSKQQNATGYALNNECVYILIGGDHQSTNIAQFNLVLPLLTSIFKYEQESTKNETDLKISKKLVTDSQSIVYKLNSTRRDLHAALIEKEKEIEFRNRAEIESNYSKAKIQNEQKRFKDIIMNAPAIIAVLKGSDHVYELANPLYMALVGKHRSIIGKTIREALPELAGQGFYELLDNVYKSGKPYIGNEILAKLDREGSGDLKDCYFNFVYQPSHNVDGSVDGVLIHAIEITELVQSRMRAEDSERKLQALADNIPNLAWMANAQGYIYWYNCRWYEYTGTSPEEMQGWGWQSTHDPKILPIVLRKWKTSIKNGKPFEMVFPLKG
ncbi:MAG: PAS domain-containing protein, partial [bacterium]|nr:PAS domain-containing protein [bacterium]